MAPTRLVLALIVTAGCSDPLVGAWQSTQFPGGAMPSDVASYRETLTFASDHTLASDTVLVWSADAGVDPGCTVTAHATGVAWDTASVQGTLGESGTPTVSEQRTGCAQTSDDESATSAPGSAPSGPLHYAIDGDTLTTSALAANGATVTQAYTRVVEMR